MKNKENIELIPKLRFLTFPIKNWDEKKLQDIFIYLSTNTYSRNLLNNKQGIYQNIHYGDILIKYGCIIDAQRDEIPYINEDVKCTTDNIIMDGDIVMADTAEDEIVGKTSEIFNIGDKKILSGLHTFWLRPLISFAPKYLGYFFNSTQYHNQLLPLIQGAKVSSISKKALNNTIIVYPSTSEQQKIADCLSSLDELIEATAQKVEALKEHKKGLMQRLFPAEGKNVPDLRFPEFQGMNGWEKKQVKDFGEVITGNTPSKKEEKYWNGDFVWITAQDFKGKYINDSILKLTKFGKEKARIIPKDSVLVTCIASIGLNAINKVECSTNQQINAICCNQGYNYEYVYYLVTFNTKYLKQLAGQTAVPIITKKSFEEFEVYAIENYNEQQKIADCLSSLDELIEATSRKVEILKEHKKGLMQQLFPKI